MARLRAATGRLHGPATVQYALLSCAFTAAYLGLEWLTRVHELEALGITLWNPVKALSVGLLLIKGVAYAPVLFLAALLADLFIYAAGKSVASSVVTSAVVAIGYATLALTLVRGLGFAMKRTDLRNVIGLLVVVPAGTVVIASFYCGFLVLFGDLALRQYWAAVRHLWVGDTVGIIILLPVGMAACGSMQRLLGSRPRVLLIDSGVFLAGTLISLWLIFSVEGASDYQFFYLLFLPVSWIAMRAGFAGASAGVCLVHLLLLAFISSADYPASTFMGYQLLVLALASNGLLLGAVVDERSPIGRAPARTPCRGSAHDEACYCRSHGRLAGASNQPAAVERRHVPPRRPADACRQAHGTVADRGLAREGHRAVAASEGHPRAPAGLRISRHAPDDAHRSRGVDPQSRGARRG